MSTNTTNYDLIKPAVNDPTDQDLWGGYLNENFDSIDALLKQGIEVTTTTKTATYLVLSSDANSLLLGDATAGAMDFDLPSASSVSGAIYHFKKIDSSAFEVVIDPDGSETIDGEASFALSSQYQTVSIVSDGTGWSKLSQSVLFSTDAEALAGSRSDVALVPSNFTQQDLSENGYIKLPGGYIQQWGVASAGSSTVTFPIEFPNEAFSITMSPKDSPIATNVSGFANLTTTGCTKTIDTYDTWYQVIGH